MILWTVAIVLGILWLLGIVALPAAGLFVHVLIVVVIILVVFQLVGGNFPNFPSWRK